MRSDGDVRTLYVGSRLSGGKSTWWYNWYVPQAVGFVVVAFDDDILVLITLPFYFVNIAAQSSLHIWMMEIKDSFFRFSGMWLDLA